MEPLVKLGQGDYEHNYNADAKLWTTWMVCIVCMIAASAVAVAILGL